MMNDRAEQAAVQAATLSDLMSRWHTWGSSYRASHQMPTDPTFRNAKSSRGWDSIGDIIEDELDGSTMETMEAQVYELPELQRYSIQVQARNLATGQPVWKHPRLPADAMERAEILMFAREALTKRLIACGVL